MKNINKILFGLLICIIPTLFVNAGNIPYTDGKYRVNVCNTSTGACAWADGTKNYGETWNINSNYTFNGLIARFRNDSKYNYGTDYLITIDFYTNPDLEQFLTSASAIRSLTCSGILNASSSWSADTTLINSCSLQNVKFQPNSNITTITILVSPTQNITGFQFNIYFSMNLTLQLSSVRVNTSSNVWVDTSTIDAINSSTDKITEEQEKTTEAINDLNDSLNDDDTSDATSDASDFFSGFTETDHGGLSAIITAPLNLIQSLTDSTCSQLVLPLPFLDNKTITLPCLSDIYSDYFGTFFTIYQTIIFAIISYGCLRSLFFDIKGFTNPDDDRIEVMDL